MIPASEILGNQVAKTLQDLHCELDAAKALTRALLKHVGTLAACRGCGASIIWVRHTDSGRNTPYDQDGVNHFITCPKAPDFKRPRTKETTHNG